MSHLTLNPPETHTPLGGKWTKTCFSQESEIMGNEVSPREKNCNLKRMCNSGSPEPPGPKWISSAQVRAPSQLAPNSLQGLSSGTSQGHPANSPSELPLSGLNACPQLSLPSLLRHSCNVTPLNVSGCSPHSEQASIRLRASSRATPMPPPNNERIRNAGAVLDVLDSQQVVAFTGNAEDEWTNWTTLKGDTQKFSRQDILPNGSPSLWKNQRHKEGEGQETIRD